MNINSRNIFIIYLLLYFSLLVGFYFNEDFALGYITDYSLHKNLVVVFFYENFSHSLLNFDKFATNHSPIYIIFFLFLEKISFSENFSRLIVLHLSLLIPYFFYLCLKIKYKFQKENLVILIPCIIFFSPYFRSSSIWLGSENLSIIFLLVSFYFFLKYEAIEEKNLSYILLNAFFLACAAYVRPIYALFSIYFFFRFYSDLKLSKKLLYYILINFLLSFPALYYVFSLDVVLIQNKLDLRFDLSRFVNQFSITISMIFFYSFPFLLTNFKNNFRIGSFKLKNVILSILFLLLLIFYFDYNLTHGGGIFYRASILIFENNYLFYIVSIISLNTLILTVINFNDAKDRVFDFTLFLVLIFLEIDTIHYHETYDPLMYIIFFLLIRSEFYLKFAKQLTSKKFIVLALFCMSFYALSILKVIHNPSERPIYQSSDINLTHKDN